MKGKGREKEKEKGKGKRRVRKKEYRLVVGEDADAHGPRIEEAEISESGSESSRLLGHREPIAKVPSHRHVAIKTKRKIRSY